MASGPTAQAFWTSLMRRVQPCWWDEAADLAREADTLRVKAKFNTGSISLTAAVALRAVCSAVRPSVVGEVGTFIGVSTRALAHTGATIYTCDVSNDCLPSSDQIRCHPYQTSTAMLRRLAKAGVTVDLWFFDGLLSTEDVPLILARSHPATVYVFDDYNEQFKGVQNVAKLQPCLPGHALVAADGPVRATTLAILTPSECW